MTDIAEQCWQLVEHPRVERQSWEVLAEIEEALTGVTDPDYAEALTRIKQYIMGWRDHV